MSSPKWRTGETNPGLRCISCGKVGHEIHDCYRKATIGMAPLTRMAMMGSLPPGPGNWGFAMGTGEPRTTHGYRDRRSGQSDHRRLGPRAPDHCVSPLARAGVPHRVGVESRAVGTAVPQKEGGGVRVSYFSMWASGFTAAAAVTALSRGDAVGVILFTGLAAINIYGSRVCARMERKEMTRAL